MDLQLREYLRNNKIRPSIESGFCAGYCEILNNCSSLITSHLPEYKQSLRLKREISLHSNKIRGLPQGSKLKPKLFTIYSG